MRSSSEERRIVVLGDSIVVGWGVEEGYSYPSLLQKWMNEQGMGCSVINAGVPGDTVIGGCLRYARDVRAHAPDVLLIGFGLNDGALGRTPYDVQQAQRWRAQRDTRGQFLLLCRQGRRGSLYDGQREAEPRVRPTFFAAALSDLVRWGRRDEADVHLLSLTPVSKKRLSADQWRRYTLYDDLIREVAQRRQVSLIDLADSDGEPFVPASMLAGDGIHLLAAGQEWLARRVYARLGPDRRKA